MAGFKGFKITDKEKQDFFKWLYANGYTPASDFDPIQHPAFLEWDKLGRPSANVTFTPGKGGTWQPVIQGGGQPVVETKPDWYSRAKRIVGATPPKLREPVTMGVETPSAPDLIESMGYIWQRTPSLVEGEPDIWTMVGRAGDKGMSAFEQAQVSRWGADEALQRQQTVEQTKFEANRLAGLRLQNQFVDWETQNTELQRQVNELQFERDRERILSGIPSNDWIRRYTLQNQPNPYKKPELDPASALEEQLDKQTASVQKWQGIAASAAVAESQPGYDPSTAAITSEQALEAVKTSEAARDKLYTIWDKTKKEQVNWTPQAVPQPYPNAPDWLAKHVPGLEAGKMITRRDVPTPSGQQITGMSTDELEQLGYYGQWAGSPLSSRRNILEAASLMQPSTPSGAGRFRTAPARQWR